MVKLTRFFKSTGFYKSVIFVIAVLVPFFGLDYYGYPEQGFAIAIGVFYCSFNNIPGSIKHRTRGMLASIVITNLITLLVGICISKFWILLPLIGLITFSVSYVSVFGFRASLVSFSGLLAMVLTFTSTYEILGLINFVALITVGGVWYFVLASLSNYINPRMYVEELLSELIELTSNYLEVRGKLLVNENEREALQKVLISYQSKITEKQENLRNILFVRRKNSGFSNRIRRKLLIFVELVEVLELAIATPVDYSKLESLFGEERKELFPFVNLMNEMASSLRHISAVIVDDEKLVFNESIQVLLDEIKEEVKEYKKSISTEKERESLYILVHLLEYQEEQYQKLKVIEHVIGKLSLNSSLLNENKEESRFITPHDYDPQKLVDNFSFKSPIFKHSLRLAIVMVLGYAIGSFFNFENTYWILLTLVVIMRPSYGLTKERVIHRLIGTFTGAFIAVGVILLTQNSYVYGTLAVFSLLMGLSLLQRNYKTFAVFITMHIIFLYALYHPDILSVVKFRVIDTCVGALLAIVANLLLFPSWEFMNIDVQLEKTLNTSLLYLKEIKTLYCTKSSVTIDYKVSRKKAFLELGNLNAAYQRMNQEPKFTQKNFSEIYNMVVLLNTFLSSVASLSTYIRTHKTTKVSAHVDVLMNNIIENLDNAIQLIKGGEIVEKYTVEDVILAKTSLEEKYKKMFLSDIEASKESLVDIETQETKMIFEQLSYLHNLSKKIKGNLSSYKK